MKARALRSAVVLSLLAAAPLASAYEEGKWLTRFGLTTVAPDTSSSSPQVGADPVNVADASSLGISVTYRVSKSLGIEVLGALPFTHDLDGSGALAGVKIGETKHLPPTVSLQWYPTVEGKFQPYVGAGLNYTVFFDEETSPAATAALGATTSGISLDPSFGLAVQVGADYQVDDHWIVNAAIWKIDIDTTADVTANGAPAATVDVAIDPLVYMIGAGYRF